MKRQLFLAVATSLFAFTAAAQVRPPTSWSSLVADRSSTRVGDSVTVLIFESSQASNSAQRGSRKTTKLSGSASADTSAHKVEGGIAGAFDGLGQTSRSDRIIASISATVVDVLQNGDLRLEGEQTLLVNGERTVIKLGGRARLADLTENNTVMSTRLADARIEYDSSGFGARSARPGIVARVMDRLRVF